MTYVPPRIWTVSPGAAASCARRKVANGFSIVPGSPSFPVVDTKNSAARAVVVAASNRNRGSLGHRACFMVCALPSVRGHGLQSNRARGRRRIGPPCSRRTDPVLLPLFCREDDQVSFPPEAEFLPRPAARGL